VGRESIALPAATPQRFESPKRREVPEPQQRVIVPEIAVAAGVREAFGAVSEVRPLDIDSRGPGAGTGADGRRGPGSGPGEGPGLGPGSGIGSGGDGEVPGNGVSWPRLVQEVKPNYTPDAMRARVEGMVELEIIVLADGSVGRVDLVRSLDSRFGLDQEAISAVRRWRFDPGRRSGQAVPVRVGVELSFTLR